MRMGESHTRVEEVADSEEGVLVHVDEYRVVLVDESVAGC